MENKQQIGFSDGFSYGNIPIKYEITKNNKLQLYVEDCARALGVIDTKELKSGKISTTIRWNRVYEDLIGIERIANSGDFKKFDKNIKKRIRNQMKDMTITETQLYLWSFRVEGEQGKKFRHWLATIVLPILREYGIYVNGMENMTPEEITRKAQERSDAYILRKYGIGVRKKLTDTIKRVINPKPYESYKYGIYTNIMYNALFNMDCKEYKELRGLKKNDSLRDNMKEKDEGDLLDLISKAENAMDVLMTTGITDENMLRTSMDNWYRNLN